MASLSHEDPTQGGGYFAPEPQPWLELLKPSGEENKGSGRRSFPRQGLWVRGSNRSLGRASTTGSNLGPHHPPVPASLSSSVEQG